MYGKLHLLPAAIGLPVFLGSVASLVAFAGGARVAHAAPDIIVSSIASAGTWTGETGVNGLRCYTFGAGFCNLGETPAQWLSGTPNTSAVAHGVFRLAGGRFEQVGVSWVSHERSVGAYNICATCQGAGPTALGVGCGTESFAPYTALWSNLTSRKDVNASTGSFMALPSATTVGPDLFYGRMPIREADILNQPTGKMFFVEAQAIHPADAAAGLGDNNHSYRRFDFVQSDLHVLFRSDTFEERPVLYAWRDHGRGPNLPDPDVRISESFVPGEGGGKFLIGSKATQVAGGRWRYDYAVQNMNCDRAARSFRVPLGSASGAANTYFHDVAYHSGDPYDGADWTPSVMGMEVGWSTQTFVANANANALRWGTVYTFSFTSSTAPQTVTATLGLFKPGAPGTLGDMLDAEALVVAPMSVACPGDANADNRVDFRDLGFVLDTWGQSGLPGWTPGDINRDGVVNTLDLNVVLSYFGGSC